ncbi:MAG: hypothetical protein ACLRM9_01540 [Collinsella aerofaciens]
MLIKARAGGGGRGIRKVESVEDAAKAFIEARAEGEAVWRRRVLHGEVRRAGAPR